MLIKADFWWVRVFDPTEFIFDVHFVEFNLLIKYLSQFNSNQDDFCYEFSTMEISTSYLILSSLTYKFDIQISMQIEIESISYLVGRVFSTPLNLKFIFLYENKSILNSFLCNVKHSCVQMRYFSKLFAFFRSIF